MIFTRNKHGNLVHQTCTTIPCMLKMHPQFWNSVYQVFLPHILKIRTSTHLVNNDWKLKTENGQRNQIDSRLGTIILEHEHKFWDINNSNTTLNYVPKLRDSEQLAKTGFIQRIQTNSRKYWSREHTGFRKFGWKQLQKLNSKQTISKINHMNENAWRIN